MSLFNFRYDLNKSRKEKFKIIVLINVGKNITHLADFLWEISIIPVRSHANVVMDQQGTGQVRQVGTRVLHSRGVPY